MRRRAHRKCIFGIILACTMAGRAPAGANTADPRPFRRDQEIAGRDFDYNDVSFLHRFTYRHRPERTAEWDLHPQGFRATAGSVKSREFYVVGELRKTFDLDERLFAEYRYRIDEDFDGDYDRSLIGAGVRLPRGWSFTTLGQIERAKENLDIYFEAAWESRPGCGLRFALVLPDAVYDRKTEEAEYEKKPLTGFASFDWVWRGGGRLGMWGNVNPDLTLQSEADRFTYDQISGGGYAGLPLGEHWEFRADARAEKGSSDQIDLVPESRVERHMNRDHLEAGVEIVRHASESWSAWLGLRTFRLDERDQRIYEPARDRELVRRERMAYGGVSWRVSDNVLLWPGIYWLFPDSTERYPQEPELDIAHDATRAKLAFPIEICFSSKSILTLNPTLRLDEPRSGGGNVQLQIPW